MLKSRAFRIQNFGVDDRRPWRWSISHKCSTSINWCYSIWIYIGISITSRLTFSVDVTVIVEVLVTKELDVMAATSTGPYATKRITAVNAIKAKCVEIRWGFMSEMSVQFRDFASSATWTSSPHLVIYARISATTRKKKTRDNSTCWPIRPARAHFYVPSVISRWILNRCADSHGRMDLLGTSSDEYFPDRKCNSAWLTGKRWPTISAGKTGSNSSVLYTFLREGYKLCSSLNLENVWPLPGYFYGRKLYAYQWGWWRWLHSTICLQNTSGTDCINLIEFTVATNYCEWIVSN